VNDQLAMIIEDNEDLAIIFAEALRAAGFETETIEDGQKAMERLDASVPAIVILDLHLPQVSGERLLRRIRKDHRFADTRVIIATADPRLADMLKDDADLVLLKPISFSQLRDLAARLSSASEVS
jgi:DNA-binding response OmpR family regulator